ncbi:hypothetical protein [Mycolicibacterium sphagni]|uniref:Uncharacterized protein n=1 Tax=Mycolicibacterium sphagni TaxID=1786 RepID=A0A255DXH0_9MYCO|nr:hypothetical protein [Mycolicibacterium sphagni]OYN80433.1 hypothetical protein CG716_09930 [Mycolicibacterium sphagni]
MSWLSGVAEVVSVSGKHVNVKCPHCAKTHQHGRGMLGSKAILAGCHAGWSRCREYRIIDLGHARK